MGNHTIRRKAATGLLAILLSSGTLAATIAPAFTGAGLPASYAAEATDPTAGLSTAEKTWVDTKASAYEGTLGNVMGVPGFKFTTTQYTKLTADQLKKTASLQGQIPAFSALLKDVPFDLATNPTGWYAKDGKTAGKEGDPVYKLSITGKESRKTITYTFTTLDAIPGDGGTTTPDKPGTDDRKTLHIGLNKDKTALSTLDGFKDSDYTLATKNKITDNKLAITITDKDGNTLYAAKVKDGRLAATDKDGKAIDRLTLKSDYLLTVTHIGAGFEFLPALVITPPDPTPGASYDELKDVTATWTDKDDKTKTGKVDGFAPTEPDHAAYTIPAGSTVRIGNVPEGWTMDNTAGPLTITLTKDGLKATYAFRHKTDGGTTDPDKPGATASYSELAGVKAIAGGKPVEGFQPTDPDHATYQVPAGVEVTLTDVPADWATDKAVLASGTIAFTLTKGNLKAVYQFGSKTGGDTDKPAETVTYDLDLSKAKSGYGFYGDESGRKVDGLTDDLTDTIKPGVYELSYDAAGDATQAQQVVVGSVFATSRTNPDGKTSADGTSTDIKVRDKDDANPDDQRIPTVQKITVNQGGLGWIVSGSRHGTVHLKLVQALDTDGQQPGQNNGNGQNNGQQPGQNNGNGQNNNGNGQQAGGKPVRGNGNGGRLASTGTAIAGIASIAVIATLGGIGLTAAARRRHADGQDGADI